MYIAPVTYLWITAVLLGAIFMMVLLYRLSLAGWIRTFGHPFDLRVLAVFGAFTVWLAIVISWLFPPLSPWWDTHFLPRDPILHVSLGFWILLLLWFIVGMVVFTRCWKSHDIVR
jgi:lysylphosphatidylglycerol synthetase-like protein (DUF2156 family)